MEPTPKLYLLRVPWEVLATVNHDFLLADRRRCFLRWVGGLLHAKTAAPAIHRCYRAAAIRVGLAPEAMAYWELRVREDARHGPWMLYDVALPLADHYPDDAWELLLGFDQHKRMSVRAALAIARAAAIADGAVAPD